MNIREEIKQEYKELNNDHDRLCKMMIVLLTINSLIFPCSLILVLAWYSILKFKVGHISLNS